MWELALANGENDRIEAAYQWTDLFERRRALMEECNPGHDPNHVTLMIRWRN